jgi:hypothetical protein
MAQAQTDPNNPFNDQMLKQVQGYPNAAANNTGVVGPQAGSTNAPADVSMPQGIDPALAAVYQGSGLNPAGRGTGFADWQYWQGVGPSQYGRLKSDIAGTGSDQPTGTPGAGAWGTSGQGANAGGGGSSFSSSSGSGIDSTKTNALFDLLMKRANTSLDVGANDPIIKAQTDAYGAQTQNAAKNYETAAAEKGGQSFNPDATARSMAEQGGQATGAFQAQLMGQELTARRGEIESALAQATQLGETQQAQLLQEELTKLQLAQQQSQFGQTLGQNAYQFGQQNLFQNSPLSTP